LKFLLEILTLLSSENNIGSDTFIPMRRSFMYIMNNRGSRFDPWGTQATGKMKYW
jgi:hypothetical protein